MTVREFFKPAVSVAVLLCATSSAWGAAQLFYADRLTAQTPQDVRDLFVLGTSGLQSEGFESSAVGLPSGGLPVFGGQGSLTQAGLAGGEIKQGNLLNGRFNTTPSCNPVTGCKWWETGETFQIALGAQKSAFGFYATDLGDAGGSISLDFWNDNTRVRSGIAVTQPTATSGLLFFGFIDDTFTFNRVTVNVSQTASNFADFDFIGFDDVLAGVRATTPTPPPNPVPAPASLSLVALGLGLLAATRARRAHSPSV
jgi:hypothetical protein